MASEKEMTIDDAVELLKANYERAKAMQFVRNPLAWALYYTWRECDTRAIERSKRNGKR